MCARHGKGAIEICLSDKGALAKKRLGNTELDEQKCTQKIGILPGPTKKWRIKRIDEVNDDELDKFYCTYNENAVITNVMINKFQERGFTFQYYFAFAVV